MGSLYVYIELLVDEADYLRAARVALEKVLVKEDPELRDHLKAFAEELMSRAAHVEVLRDRMRPESGGEGSPGWTTYSITMKKRGEEGDVKAE